MGRDHGRGERYNRPGVFRNCWRQFYAEHLLGRRLRRIRGQFELAVAVSEDVAPLRKLSAIDVANARLHDTVVTSTSFDYHGVTNCVEIIASMAWHRVRTGHERPLPREARGAVPPFSEDSCALTTGSRPWWMNW